MAHLLLGNFPAVAGVFHTKGYLMDETPNQGMSGMRRTKWIGTVTDNARIGS